jgi:hypothetical protein
MSAIEKKISAALADADITSGDLSCRASFSLSELSARN